MKRDKRPRGERKHIKAAAVMTLMVVFLVLEYKVLRSSTLARRQALAGHAVANGGNDATDRIETGSEEDLGGDLSLGAEPAAPEKKTRQRDEGRGGDDIAPNKPFRLDPKLHPFVMYTFTKDKEKSYGKTAKKKVEQHKGKKGEDGPIAHLEGEHGGEWDWCVHVGFHGLLFDWGFSRFVAFHLKPKSTLDFGCGIGLHVDYLTRYEEANMTHAMGIEPNAMSAAGVFGRKHPRARIPPIGIALNVAEQPDDVLEAFGTFEVVYTLEVMEHIPPQFHDKISTFLVKRTSKYLLFSAAQPGQHGRGHIPESSRTPQEWIAIFQAKGLFYLPMMSEKLKKAAYAIWSHRENIFMMGTSMDLDSDTPVDKRVHWNRKQVAHKVLFPLLQKGSEEVIKTQDCDAFPINTDTEPFDMHQIM